MKLHPTTIRQDDEHRAIADALTAESTLVFVDTNVLFWLFSLGAPARAEFIRWANDELDARLLVPVWAAHELYGYLRSNQSALTPLNASMKGLEKSIDEAKKHIAMAAEERPLTGYADLSAYLADVDRMGRDLMRLCGLAPVSGWETLAAEIIPFVNRHVLGSNIFPILKWIDTEMEARLEGRIPPGYADKKKEDNRFGDRVLWDEVLMHCKGKTAGAVVVLTNDNKEDWIYRPAGIKDASGTRRTNEGQFRTVLPSPLLLHELKTRTSMTDLHVLNVETFVVVMHRYATRPVPQLFRAVQPLVAPTAEELAARTPRRTRRGAGGTPIEMVTEQDEVELPAIGDLIAAGGDLRPVIADLARELAETNPFQQEAAVARLMVAQDPPLAPLESFALGRALRETILTGMQSAINVVANLAVDDVATPAETALFAGVLHGLYFDPANRRRRLPLDEGAETILSASERPSLAPAVRRVMGQLSEFSGRYLGLPSPGARPQIAITLDLERQNNRSAIVLGLRVGEVDLLEELEAGENDTLSTFIADGSNDGFGRGTVAKLRQALGKRYSVPQNWLTFDEPDETKLKWSNTKGFRRL